MKLRGGLTQILLPADCEFPEDPEALASVFDGCDSLIAIYAPGPGSTKEFAEAAHIPFVSTTGEGGE